MIPLILTCASALVAGGFARIPCAALLVAAATTGQSPAVVPPQVNGARVFGVRPNAPFLYQIPATGDRPIAFSADGLPAGLSLDAATGSITGTLATPGEHAVTLRASNRNGTGTAPLRIVVGERIALTPPMGWNSWNCWHSGVDQEKVLRSARGMVAAGLVRHGWQYVNLDDGWQGARGGPLNAIQPDPAKFPDFKGMCDQIHAMGLKVGIYSTPWVTSYARRVGGSSSDPAGAWDPSLTTGPKNVKKLPYAIGPYHFFKQDARQWAAWGVDYLKFDWGPNELPETREMADALRASGRDIVLSLSNNTAKNVIHLMPQLTDVANSWRTGGDITDTWRSVAAHGFGQDAWAPFSGPGHWNDPDMFEVGTNGGGKPKRLTPDEQRTHVSVWCLLSAPLLLGCDLDHLDPFTVDLLSNDEVVTVDQDPLGRQATTAAKVGQTQVLVKDLADGSRAVGLCNLGPGDAAVTATWADLHLGGRQRVRDLWQRRDLGPFDGQFQATVPSHGVVFVRVSPLN